MRRHPLAVFFFLTFLVTWAVWVPRAVGSEWAATVGTIWSYGPAIAAVLAALVVGGRKEARRLLAGLDKWRIGWTWYAVILGGPLALGLVAAAANVALGGEWRQGLPDVFDGPLFVVFILIVILSVTDGLGEELGWRGFALPRLLARGNAVAASIALGVVWALWHLPLFWTEGSTLDGSHVWLVFARLPATAVIFTWVYQHTRGSVVAAAILHAALNLFSVAPPTRGETLTPTVATLVIHWVAAIGLTVMAGSTRLDGLPSPVQETDPEQGVTTEFV